MGPGRSVSPELASLRREGVLGVGERGGSSRRARCLGCGALGPDREDVEQAMLALRDQARCKQSLGA